MPGSVRNNPPIVNGQLRGRLQHPQFPQSAGGCLGNRPGIALFFPVSFHLFQALARVLAYGVEVHLAGKLRALLMGGVHFALHKYSNNVYLRALHD